MDKQRTYPLKVEPVTDAIMSAVNKEIDKMDRKFPGLDLSSLTNSVFMAFEKRTRDLGLAPAFHRFHKGNRMVVAGVLHSSAARSGHVRRAGNRMVIRGIVQSLIEDYEERNAKEEG